MSLILSSRAVPARGAELPVAATPRNEATEADSAVTFADVLSRSLQPADAAPSGSDKTPARRRASESSDGQPDMVNPMAPLLNPLDGAAARASTATAGTDMSIAATNAESAAELTAGDRNGAVVPAIDTSAAANAATVRQTRPVRTPAQVGKPLPAPARGTAEQLATPAAPVTNSPALDTDAAAALTPAHNAWSAPVPARANTTELPVSERDAAQPDTPLSAWASQASIDTAPEPMLAAARDAMPMHVPMTAFTSASTVMPTPTSNSKPSPVPASAPASASAALDGDVVEAAPVAQRAAAADGPAMRAAATALNTTPLSATPVPARTTVVTAQGPTAAQPGTPPPAPVVRALRQEAAQVTFAAWRNAAPVPLPATTRSATTVTPAPDPAAQPVAPASAAAIDAVVRMTQPTARSAGPVPARDGAVLAPDAARLATQVVAPITSAGSESATQDDTANRQPSGAGTPLPGLGAAPAPVNTGATGVASAASAGVLTPEVGTGEWGKALGRQLLQLGRAGHQVAELQLNPAGLGPLKVTLNMSHQQVEVSFVSAHSVVRAAVEAALPQLRSSLADSGISLGHTSVSANSQQQTAYSQAQGGAGGQRSYRNNPTPADPAPSAASAVAPLRRSTATSVDTYA